MDANNRDFPKYLLKVDGRAVFVPMEEAAILYNSGLVSVEFGEYVLNPDFTATPMSTAEKHRISNAADRVSAST